MQIRRATAADAESIATLFYNTVTLVNTKDYNAEQIEAWAKGHHNTAGWLNKIAAQYFIVAENDSELAGFASITPQGYIDFMFVHHEKQGQGIAANLLNHLHQHASQYKIKELTTHASITARPFFEHHGFTVVKQQSVDVRGVQLTNFVMEKVI